MLENTFHTKENTSVKLARALRLKSDLSITVCSWLSVLKQEALSWLGRLAATACLLRYPTFLNKINVIKVVKVIL